MTLGQELGFHNVVIGSLAPMVEAGDVYKHWVSQGYAATMDYLKRDPQQRVEPARTFAGSRSVIIASVSYYTEPQVEPPLVSGRVARYAVGLDYHPTIRAKMREYSRLIEVETGLKVSSKPFTDDVALYEQALASRHGLGFVGKNSLILGPRLSGSYNFIAELFLDVELEPDVPYIGTCGQCFRCGTACPTDAIKGGAMVDSNLCISFLTIENKGGIEESLRKRMGEWVFGCDICQEVCPYNSRPQTTPWPEFFPSAGVGHHLDLIDLLQIKDDIQFRARFEKSPVRRPKRRGLLRNALVVLGNHLSAGHRESDRIIAALDTYAQNEVDEMLVEHCAWALSCSSEVQAGAVLDFLATRHAGSGCAVQIRQYAAAAGRGGSADPGGPGGNR